LVWSTDIAALARQHNDANVMGLGARQHDVETAKSLVDTFVTTAFSGDERHARRIAMVAGYEESGTL
jgi:ribose 5-phosphate isomerase B